MSSDKSENPNDPHVAVPKAGVSRGPVALVIVTIALLAALVWALKPARPNYKPAPLQPVSAECPKTAAEFVPSNYTDIQGLDLESLSAAQRNHALFRLNMEPCPCGCNKSIAFCLLNHPACKVAKQVAEKIVADERAAAHSGN